MQALAESTVQQLYAVGCARGVEVLTGWLAVSVTHWAG